MVVALERQFDAIKINEILNDPDVRPDVAEHSGGALDVTAGVANQNNVLLMGEYGGCFFIKLMPGVYEVHTQALKPGRGRWIAEFVLAAGDWMFTHTDAYEIVTRIPSKHLAARLLARHAGMMSEFTRSNECGWRGELQNCDIYSYRIQDWVAESCPEFQEQGREFHDFLHAEAARLGVTDPAHDDDPNHNRYVGIALAMMEAGQVQKAINFYNRWALISRHPTIALESLNPLRVRIDLGTLVIENGTRCIERLKVAA